MEEQNGTWSDGVMSAVAPSHLACRGHVGWPTKLFIVFSRLFPHES
jgi:hypothetical protein